MFKIYDGRDRFYQWDLDRKLIVEDAEITQVHFCNRTEECSLVCETYTEDGLNIVNVPNILLQDNWRINVYAYDRNYTKFSEIFDVMKRSKPESYVYTEEEIHMWQELEARIDEIEENGISDETVSAAVKEYLDENDIQVDLTGYATEAYVDAAIETIELTPGPEGKPGKDFTYEDFTEEQLAALKGKDGEPGKDGYTPVKGVDYFDGAPGADGEDGKDYVLTEADKQEIAGMVPGADVDLTDYYTKDEIDDLLANLPVGDIPSGEEVEF